MKNRVRLIKIMITKLKARNYLKEKIIQNKRNMPIPVLVGHVKALDGLAQRVDPITKALAEAFWPGALTIIVKAQPTLRWDLGDSNQTVALRMPLNPSP